MGVEDSESKGLLNLVIIAIGIFIIEFDYVLNLKPHNKQMAGISFFFLKMVECYAFKIFPEGLFVKAPSLNLCNIEGYEHMHHVLHLG